MAKQVSEKMSLLFGVLFVGFLVPISSFVKDNFTRSNSLIGIAYADAPTQDGGGGAGGGASGGDGADCSCAGASAGACE